MRLCVLFTPPCPWASLIRVLEVIPQVTFYCSPNVCTQALTYLTRLLRYQNHRKQVKVITIKLDELYMRQRQWTKSSLELIMAWPLLRRHAITWTNSQPLPWTPITVKCVLTRRGRDKMVAIFQTTFSNTFSGKKMFEFRLRFHWNLFLRFQLTISEHWFR